MATLNFGRWCDGSRASNTHNGCGRQRWQCSWIVRAVYFKFLVSVCQSSARVRLDSKLTAVKTCTAEPDVRETQRGFGFPQFDDKSEQHAELDYQGRTATC